jgi:hypothetical protein
LLSPIPRKINEYHVFLASPSDVSQERDYVRDFFRRYNQENSRNSNVKFEVVDWENYATIGVGRPQDLITKQTLEKYKESLALVIGIMAQRFGAPTGNSKSGTEEEFNWAMESYKKSGFPEIKWFFRKIYNLSMPPDPENLEDAVDQWKKVRDFRKRIEDVNGDSVFYKEYSSLDDFHKVFDQDLRQWLNAPERDWTKYKEQDATSRVSDAQDTMGETKGILVLSANPREKQIEYIETEIEIIKNTLAKAQMESLMKKGKKPIFKVVEELDIKADSLSEVLSSVDPYIIHIAGCEEGIEKLTIGENSGLSKTNDTIKLTGDLFEFSPKNTECIILSRCYCIREAKEIVRHVNYVIGINKNAEEQIVIDFLKQFYNQLGSHRGIKEAYGIAYNHIGRNSPNSSSLFILLDKITQFFESKLIDFEEEISKTPENPDLWRDKGKILKSLKRFHEANEAYERASSLSPTDYKIREEQGDILNQSGGYQKAIKAYEQALNINVDDYRIWWKKAGSLARAGQYDKSIESYERALGLYPSPSDKYVINRELAWVLSESGENRKSIAEYKATLQSEPRYRAAKYEKKLVYKKMYLRK